VLFIIFKHKLQGIGSRSENYCQFNKKLSCRKEAAQCSVSLKIYLSLSHSKSFEFTSSNMACVSSYSSSIVTMAISSSSLIDDKSDKSRRQTELLWFGSTMNLRRLPADTSIRINNCVIQPATVVRDLDVWIDSELSRREHVSCGLLRHVFFHLRRLRSVRRELGRDVSARLVSAVVLSRLDYCNAVLVDLPAATLAPRRVLHAAARLVLGLKPRDHVTQALRELHWLPVVQRTEYKLCFLVHRALIGQVPNHITNLLT